mmetsp:Transcript_27103/g.76168  ORF Transcript_27103/g.76168 Transcript_27103/m.76168 type:complete len:117 (-) Transcript_27103:171-521(-)
MTWIQATMLCDTTYTRVSSCGAATVRPLRGRQHASSAFVELRVCTILRALVLAFASRMPSISNVYQWLRDLRGHLPARSTARPNVPSRAQRQYDMRRRPHGRGAVILQRALYSCVP